MKITQEELIEMICEGVNKKIASLISEKTYMKENDMINMVEETIMEYMDTSDTSIFGSDKFDYDDTYEAIDYYTMNDILSELGWEIVDMGKVKSPTGREAISYEITNNFEPDVPKLQQAIKERAIEPKGIKIIRYKGNYRILVFLYKND